jgi:hypothetical protein
MSDAKQSLRSEALRLELDTRVLMDRINSLWGSGTCTLFLQERLRLKRQDLREALRRLTQSTTEL